MLRCAVTKYFFKATGPDFSGRAEFGLKFVKMFQAISGLHTILFHNDGYFCRQFKKIFNKND